MAASQNPQNSREVFHYRPHQLKFIQTQLALRESPGSIIDHEVGSGKTATVIGVCEALRRFDEYKTAQVIVLTKKALVDGFLSELVSDVTVTVTVTITVTVTVTTVHFRRPNRGTLNLVMERCWTHSVTCTQ